MSIENLPWNARQWQSDKYTFNWCVEDCKKEDVVSACTKEQALVLASSPDLLEACEDVLALHFEIQSTWEESPLPKDLVAKLQAAIAKAKGEQ